MTDLVKRVVDGVDKQVIVVIGDVMVDRWVHGKTAPCQDGCTKFVQHRVVDVPGGAANAARSIEGWAVRTELCGYALNDCPVKCRYVTDSGIQFRVDIGEDVDRGPKYKWARTLALEWVNCATAVLLSDYDKGFLTHDFIKEVSARCKERGVSCVADCKRGPGLYEGCILKGNEDYWARWPAPTETEIVMTRGSDDPWMLKSTEPSGLLLVKCVNHVGAGDCFAAHLTLGLGCGLTLKDAAAFAHSAGRVYVQHPHNRPPLPSEIAADLASAAVSPPPQRSHQRAGRTATSTGRSRRPRR